MEDHHELEQLLLAGLSPSDRRHVVETMRQNDAAKLCELRSSVVVDEAIADENSVSAR
jgi:hypothetical protein